MEEYNQDNSITNTPIEPEQPLTPKPRKKLNKTTIIATIAIIFGLAGIGFGVYGMFFKKPAPTTSENKPESGEENETTSSDFDLSHLIIKDENCLGDYCAGQYAKNEASMDHNCGIYVIINEDGTATINLSSQETWCYPKIESGKDSFVINNFKSQPVGAIVATLGQAIGYETIFFLMADGTVEYVPVYYAVQNNDLRSYGQVAGVKEVIRFILTTDCDESNMGCGNTALAQRNDGKFYDIGRSVNFNPDTEKYYKH